MRMVREDDGIMRQAMLTDKWAERVTLPARRLACGYIPPQDLGQADQLTLGVAVRSVQPLSHACRLQQPERPPVKEKRTCGSSSANSKLAATYARRRT